MNFGLTFGPQILFYIYVRRVVKRCVKRCSRVNSKTANV